jgi:hypothetical protein
MLQFFYRCLLILILPFSFCSPSDFLQAQTIRDAVKLVPIQLDNPLDGELYISGTFGEPRPNHYHSGLDIKTGGKIGWPVKAVDEGYLSRIKISAGGYGKALYINHPSGLTSVYAHLEEFSEPLASMVRNWQYEKESFELDTLLPKDLIKYKRGQTIALSGNTGSSAGPHLHFEIRETISESAVNPMRYLNKIKDTQPPSTGNVRIYSFQRSIYESSPQIVKPVMGNGQWVANVLTQEGKICLSVEAFDKQDLTPEHKNGIPILRMFDNDQLVFSRKTDTIDFSMTRYAHALIDYGARLTNGTDCYLFCRLPGNREENPYQFSPGNGIMEIKAGQQKRIRLELEDFHGNISVIHLNIQSKAPNTFNSRLLDSSGTIRSVQIEGAILEWKDDSWYDQPIYDIQIKTLQSPDIFSSTYSLFLQTLPAIHAPLTFSLRNHYLPEQFRNKGLLVLENYKGNKKALETTVTDSAYSANFNEPGHIYLSIDTTPPKISLLNFNEAKNMFTGNQIRCSISDNLSGIQSYRGTIDGQWILMEYDAKSSTLSYTFDEKCPSGEHQFQLVVTDGKSNTNTFTKPFKK